MERHLFRNITKEILTPIIKEFPFFCMYSMLMGNSVIRRLHGKTVSQYPDISYWDMIVSATVVFLFAYFFSCILSQCKKKWIHVAAYCLIISLFSIDFFLIQNFKMCISPQILVLLAETNTRESTEFINTFMGIRENAFVYSVVLFTIFSSYLFEKTYHSRLLPYLQRKSMPWMRSVLAIVLATILVFGVYGSATYVRMLRCQSTDDLSWWDLTDKSNPHDPLTNCFYALQGIYLGKSEMNKAVEATRNMDFKVTCNEDSLTVVFVIGESYIKKHGSIYGYGLATTPSLQEEADSCRLYVFQDVCSPFNMTSYAMKSLLCCNSISEGEQWYEAPFMPAVFRSAGFNVVMWDNQKDDNPGASFSFALNSFLYNKEIASSFNSTNNNSFQYDGDLVSDFVAHVKDVDSTNNFVIFHLMGQHGDASCRYPREKDFVRFTSDSIKRKEAFLSLKKKTKIAEYDNATYYNDFVLSAIIDQFEKKNSVIVYLSDHGEEIYDYRDFEGRRAMGAINANLLLYQYGVPFMIWCSSKYQESHPETIEAIKGAVDRPFMTDNVCQVLFHLAGIESSYYKPERDVLSDKYRKPKRIVNNTIDYDAYVH